MKKLLSRPVFWIMVVIVVAVVAGMLGACDKRQPDIPSRDPLPCQSHIGLDGRWYDSDGEVVDEDPCDGVDVKKSSAPVIKPHQTSAPKKSTAPAPRVTRR